MTLYKLLFALLIVFFFTAVYAQQSIQWEELLDPDSQKYEDPYTQLSSDQLLKLIKVAALRKQLSDEFLESEKRSELQNSLIEHEKVLSSTGIDIDFILSQRWIVAERRKKATTEGNASLNGQRITITGYTIPVTGNTGDERFAYLVPERGMCSHMPPPQPNQLIKVQLSGDWSPAGLYEPVELTGDLSIEPSSNTMLVVDGMVRMNATYRLDAVSAKSFQTSSSAPTNAYGNNLKAQQSN